MEKISQANGTKKQVGVAILISDKIDLKVKLIRRDKQGHYILIKGKIKYEELTIINIHTPNSDATNFINTIMQNVKARINSNTLIVGDINTLLSPLDRSTGQNNKQRHQN